MTADYQPGDAVETLYGTGVIVKSRVSDDDDTAVFVVRLWRTPGKSMGSSASAYLHKTAIVGKLPVVPGLTSQLGGGHSMRGRSVLVRAYCSHKKFPFLVSPEDDLNSDIWVKPADLRDAPSLHFYPILDTLLSRANETVSLTHNLVHSVQSKVTNGAGSPDDWQQQILLQLRNDERLTSLLHRCKERLQQIQDQENLTVSEASVKILEQTGITILQHDKADISENLSSSRATALSSLDQWLGEGTNLSLEDVGKNFRTALESLQSVAQSDRDLQKLWQDVANVTSDWQKATGQLFQTRSAALFMEGASRLQTRALALLDDGKRNVSSAVFDHWTKSFTEGDAALAKLKSIQLGDAVKTRLVEAIEVRSDSVGGLDGIIVGTFMDQGGDLPPFLEKLKTQATGTATEARETLLGVLSSQSEYRDVTLQRLEKVLSGLHNQLGSELSPEDIAKFAQGKGGTSKLFRPIAKKAMEQIDHHLDEAESQVHDAGVLQVLKRVRKIMSGELSVSAIMEEVVGVLNNEDVVATGEKIVQQSEKVLDAIEGVSGSKAVLDAIEIAEKAGITKEAVMREIQKIDVDKLIDEAGSAVTDERARQKLISSATDTALDFALRVLPSMPVPPFEGVKDGLVYQISNLSMEGFRVRKEDIHIQLAGMRATKTRGVMGQDLNSAEADGNLEITEITTQVKATELLIIDIHDISAVLDDASWRFEQTYMPYLKGNGLASTKMSGGDIRLQFELRKSRKETEAGEVTWEPVLCLHDRSCSISEVDLTLEGSGSLTWIVNKLAGVFRVPLRDYVVKTIVNVLSNRSGWILSRLNRTLSPYWDLILRTAKLNMDDLVETDEEVIVAQAAAPSRNLVELVWREGLPLGMNLLTNDQSGELKVVDFPRGSQARLVCERRKMDPSVFEGATVLAVNGFEYDDSDELFDALRDPGRPKTVGFQLAKTEEVERVRQFVETAQKVMPSATRARKKTPELREVTFTDRNDLGIEFASSIDKVSLTVNSFLEREDGIVSAAEKSGQVRVGDILVRVNGAALVDPTVWNATKTIDLLQQVANTRPLSLHFSDPFVYSVQLKKVAQGLGIDSNGGPDELIIEELPRRHQCRRVGVTGYNEVSGMAETSGILIGDHLVFVNGIPVGAACRWMGATQIPELQEIYSMLKDKSAYPMGLTFARPKTPLQNSWEAHTSSSHLLRDDEADTVCVAADSEERIGCVFEQTEEGDIVVKDFYAIPGVFQCAIRAAMPASLATTIPVLTIESLNDQLVPSYADVEMVRSAIKRSWSNASDELKLTVCDDELRAFVENMGAKS